MDALGFFFYGHWEYLLRVLVHFFVFRFFPSNCPLMNVSVYVYLWLPLLVGLKDGSVLELCSSGFLAHKFAERHLRQYAGLDPVMAKHS